MPEPKPWNIPVPRLHHYTTYSKQYNNNDFEPYIKFPKEKLAALFLLLGSELSKQSKIKAMIS